MKILIATEKPFAAAAVNGIRETAAKGGLDVVLLEKYTDKTQLLEAVADADALIVRSDKVTEEVINAAKSLKIVVRAGAGYDNLDLPACTSRGIVAMNTPGQNANAVAELAISMIIYMSRNQFTPGTGTEISGKKIGIQRSKGLGENDPEMMWLTTMNPDTRRMVKVMPEDVERTAAMFDLLLGDNLQGRKDHIANEGYRYLELADIS